MLELERAEKNRQNKLEEKIELKKRINVISWNKSQTIIGISYNHRIKR